MMKLFRDWLLIPFVDAEEKAFSKLLVLGICRAFTVAAALYILVPLIFSIGLDGVPFAVAALGVFGITYLLLQRDAVRGAGFFLCFSIWLVISASIIVQYGRLSIYDAGYSAYILVVLLAGVLLGGRAGLFFAGISTVIGVFVATQQISTSNLDLRISVSDVWLRFSAEAIFFFTGAGLLFLGEQIVRQAFIQSRSSERRLNEQNALLQQEIEERRQAEARLNTAQENSTQFQSRLKALHEINIELSSVTALNDLYKRAVELARSTLGFDRVGVLLVDWDTQIIRATWGTDEHGNLVDERSFVYDFKEHSQQYQWLVDGITKRDRIIFNRQIEILYRGKVQGQGWNALGAIWKGDRIFGWMAADNLIQQEPLQDYQLELLSLYGTLLGHLIDRIQSAQELENRDQRLHLALDAAGMVTWYWDLKTDVLNYHRTEDRQVNPGTFAEFRGHLLPEYQRVVQEAAEAALAGKGRYHVAYRYYDRDQQIRWGTSIGQAYRDNQDQVVGMIGVTLDTTDRKRVDDALRVSEERFQTIFQSSPSGILISELDTARIIDLNAAYAQWIGYTREECIGKTGYDLNLYLNHADRDAFAEQIRRGERIHGEEIRRRNRAGGVIHGLLSVEPIELTGKSYLLSMVQDITERKQAEVQALDLVVQKERLSLLTEFMSNISHDLKTPLAIISNSAYLLERLTNEDRRREKVILIRQQTERLERSIQDMLTIARLDTVPTLERRTLNLNLIVEDMQAQFGDRAVNKDITFESHLHPGPLWVAGSADELDRVLGNLVENALNYTPEHGTVSISSRQHEGQVIVAVTDSGIGIAPEAQARIFERFYRADEARSTHTGGTGLGLAIVKRIVEMHGGYVEVSSVMGEGATFQVCLPLAPAP
jgi:PAS domain S-box-containing protein